MPSAPLKWLDRQHWQAGVDLDSVFMRLGASMRRFGNLRSYLLLWLRRAIVRGGMGVAFVALMPTSGADDIRHPLPDVLKCPSEGVAVEGDVRMDWQERGHGEIWYASGLERMAKLDAGMVAGIERQRASESGKRCEPDCVLSFAGEVGKSHPPYSGGPAITEWRVRYYCRESILPDLRTVPQKNVPPSPSPGGPPEGTTPPNGPALGPQGPSQPADGQSQNQSSSGQNQKEKKTFFQSIGISIGVGVGGSGGGEHGNTRGSNTQPSAPSQQSSPPPPSN
jgi:hypothetical protein